MDSEPATGICSARPARKRPRADEERDPDLYLEDGNIVLSASHQGTVSYFRVHKSVLSKHSPIFRDMLAMPPPANIESYDNNPLVRLSDDAKDLKRLLEILYDPCALPVMRYGHDTAAQLLGPLRLANKYEIDALRARMITILELDWPATLQEWDARAEVIGKIPTGQNHPDPVTAVQLAIECNVPSILPLATYALSCMLAEYYCNISRLPNEVLERLIHIRDTMLDRITSVGHSIAILLDTRDDCSAPECTSMSYFIRMKCFRNPADPLLEVKKALVKLRSANDEDLDMEMCNRCQKNIERFLEDSRVALFKDCQKFYKAKPRT